MYCGIEVLQQHQRNSVYVPAEQSRYRVQDLNACSKGESRTEVLHFRVPTRFGRHHHQDEAV
jgi:hypothetical protein